MANKRTYATQAATVNGTALGGTTEIGGDIAYASVVQAGADGLEGPAAIDRLVKAVKGQISSQDVKKFLTLLNSTASEMTWYLAESGAAMFGTYALDDPVIIGGSLDLAKSALSMRYATMRLDYEALHASADDFDDVLGYLDAQTEPSYTKADRLLYPIAATHGGVTILHPSSLSVTVQAQVIRETGDGDLGVSAIDIVKREITVRLGFQDQSKQAGSPTHELATKLMMASMGDLVVTVLAAQGGANQTITLRNCHWTRDAGRHQAEGYTEHALEGRLQWLDDDGTTKRSMNGTDLIMTIAPAA